MSFKAMKSKGILGMNARIGNYLNPLNKRSLYPLVDDKVITSELAKLNNVAMPANYKIYSSQGDLRKLKVDLSAFNDFVIKPARGSQGNGILVLERVDENVLKKPNGDVFTYEDIRAHLSGILSGLYSLNGNPDKAIIQYRVGLHSIYKDIAFGIPDIRIIVLNGYPVMAMTRIPTLESGGRANLHQGAIGLGLSIASGFTTKAVLRNKTIEYWPHNKKKIESILIPNFKELLLIASKSYDMTGLGYLGADLCLDADLGPLVLELNARPGLAIQIANGMGLEKILIDVNNFDSSIPAIEKVNRMQNYYKENSTLF